MKYFPIMTVEQVSALDDAAIAKAINVACAEAGIPIFSSIGDPPQNEVQPDTTVYKVLGLMYLDRAHAEAVATAANANARYEQTHDSHWNAQPTYKHSDSEIEVTTGRLFAPDSFARQQIEIETLKRQQKDYEAKAEAWGESSHDRERISAEVWEEVNDCRAKIRNRERVVELYNRYVELAGTEWLSVDGAPVVVSHWADMPDPPPFFSQCNQDIPSLTGRREEVRDIN